MRINSCPVKCRRKVDESGHFVDRRHLRKGDLTKRPLARNKYIGIVSYSQGLVLDHAPTAEGFVAFILKNEALLVSECRCIGSWQDGETHYVDISQICLDWTEAQSWGRYYNQDSIYLPEKGSAEKVIYDDAQFNILAKEYVKNKPRWFWHSILTSTLCDKVTPSRIP